jgi:hypothetical protein
MRELISFLSRRRCILAAAALLALSSAHHCDAGCVRCVGRSALITQNLRSIGVVVIGIAVFDVIFLSRKRCCAAGCARPGARQSLTKFMTIIVIATSLEGLVLNFRSGQRAHRALLYPVILLGISVVALVGLGVFQWLSRAWDAAKRKAALPARESPRKARLGACLSGTFPALSR